MPQIKEDIIQELDIRMDRLLDWLNNHDAAKFNQGPEGKWTTSQHVDHLIKSMQPLNMALRLPKLQLRTMFGKPNRPTRDYDTVVARYLERLGEREVVPPKNFAPTDLPVDKKEETLASLDKERENLKKIIAKWDEEKLDKYLLPHPLLGKMVVREMLFFTLYHTDHHAKNLRENY